MWGFLLQTLKTSTHHQFSSNHLTVETMENCPKYQVVELPVLHPCPPQTMTRISQHVPLVSHWTMQMPEKTNKQFTKYLKTCTSADEWKVTQDIIILYNNLFYNINSWMKYRKLFHMFQGLQHFSIKCITVVHILIWSATSTLFIFKGMKTYKLGKKKWKYFYWFNLFKGIENWLNR